MRKMPNSDYYHVFMYWKRRRGYMDPKRTPEMVESIHNEGQNIHGQSPEKNRKMEENLVI